MIGEKILAAREAANMTQEELGKAVGVSRDTIRRWEKEKTSPSIEQLMTIARVTANEPLLSLCQDLFEKAQSVKRDNTEKLPIPVISMRTPACAGDGNGIEVIIPLARQTMELLANLKTMTGDGRWLFPSARNDGRCMSENTVRVALRSLGYENGEMTPHGFRSMASTVLNEHGFQPDVIERQLAHAEKNSIRAAYNHAEYLPQRRELMQWWADFLDNTKLK